MDGEYGSCFGGCRRGELVAFKQAKEEFSGLEFNSTASFKFKEVYDKIVYDKYKKQIESKPSTTFAPSSFRCDRLSFFRIRGVDPDPVSEINKSLEFSAMLGTACHEEIQTNLKNALGENWVDVPTFLTVVHKLSREPYDYTIRKQGELETQIEFFNPPVKFSCDGILKLEGEFYLLEIKTSEYQSFKSLKAPKPQHIDQIKCYCSLLELNKALVLYQDRLYGDIKCYEITVQDYEMQEIYDRMNKVLEYVDKNIAPPRLPNGDYWCTYCKYRQRCKQWG